MKQILKLTEIIWSTNFRQFFFIISSFLYCFKMIEISLEENGKMKGMPTKHDIASSKQKFESDDSEGSDLSYESSLTDEEDNNIGRIQFFKEEMARFFINYPELINKNIIQQEPQSEIDVDEEVEKQEKVNRNWQSIAEQILNQAKESSTSLQSLAKRISLYRYKIDQSDIIDLLLQEKNVILKQLDAEILQKNSEANLIGRNEKHDKNNQNKHNEDNVYYSWINQKIFKSKYVDKEQSKHPVDNSINKRKGSVDSGERTKTVHRFTKSLHKANYSENKGEKRTGTRLTNFNKNPLQNTKKGDNMDSLLESGRSKNEALDESQMNQNRFSRDNNNWRHLVNFEPKTDIGRQLSEQIKKNSYSDELGIKKTIINFLANYKEMINNEVINKVTLSQKIQKLYNEDAKELLMFYPSKINNYENGNVSTSNSFKQNSQEDKFIKLLKQINDGPLMKYWRQLQQSKV